MTKFLLSRNFPIQWLVVLPTLSYWWTHFCFKNLVSDISIPLVSRVLCDFKKLSYLNKFAIIHSSLLSNDNNKSSFSKQTIIFILFPSSHEYALCWLFQCSSKQIPHFVPYGTKSFFFVINLYTFWFCTVVCILSGMREGRRIFSWLYP